MTAKTRNVGLLLIAFAVVPALAFGWWWYGRRGGDPSWSKAVGTRTREELQRQLVGNWHAMDGSDRVFAFDERWRVSSMGQGTGLQEVHPDMVAGRVTYEIDTSNDLPTLQINYPPGSERASQQFHIRRLEPGVLEWGQDATDLEKASEAFERLPGDPISVINEEEENDDPGAS
jgi:hypothetical protein